MIWINENFNILSEEELIYLKDKCDNFVITQKPNLSNNTHEKNFYNRYVLNLNDSLIKSIINKITNVVKETVRENLVDLKGLWINKVDYESNKTDGFHIDLIDLTFILYLNENFDGGEFEYLDKKDKKNKKIKIKPKINLSIISNNELYHRVLPVLNGERFSLVMFFNVGKKKDYTLI
jgi:hypothetical protein